MRTSWTGNPSTATWLHMPSAMASSKSPYTTALVQSPNEIRGGISPAVRLIVRCLLCVGSIQDCLEFPWTGPFYPRMLKERYAQICQACVSGPSHGGFGAFRCLDHGKAAHMAVGQTHRLSLYICHKAVVEKSKNRCPQSPRSPDRSISCMPLYMHRKKSLIVKLFERCGKSAEIIATHWLEWLGEMIPNVTSVGVVHLIHIAKISWTFSMSSTVQLLKFQ